MYTSATTSDYLFHCRIGTVCHSEIVFLIFFVASFNLKGRSFWWRAFQTLL